ncbi:MAG: pentapeptide repeat-containing protein, partial [Cyanobacteriota bacterium]|nr:pentapeptide repeat-containing protein [Cyanobacteriota bacterium]
ILERAKLSNTTLKNAYLLETNLKDADLQGADLSDTTLERAYLMGANLQKANYDSKTIWTYTYYNEQTVFPLGFDEKIKKQMNLLQ